MQTRTIGRYTLTLVLLGACVNEDSAFDDFLEHADSRTTGGTDDGPGNDTSGPMPATTGSSGGTGSDTEAPSDATTTGADAPPEILEFAVDPPLIDETGPVNITAAFSPGVTQAVLFEKYDGETHVLEVLEPAGPLAHEYAVTSDSLNGAHEVYLQAFDSDGLVDQATSGFDVALGPGGTSAWHEVDYDPDDPAIFVQGADVAVHGDGIVVVGVRYVAQEFQLIARRYTANHEVDWEFEALGVWGTAVAVDADNNVTITGTFGWC